MPIEIDHENQCAGRPPPSGFHHARGTPRRLGHRSAPADSKARRKPRRTCCSRRTDDTCRLLGSARITTWSHGCRLPSSGRATCRNRRATRCRSTAVPTDLAIINPTRGLLQSCDCVPRRTWTTTSGCTVRTPYLTVASNSVDRLMRLRADSTAKKPAATIRQSVRGGPYGAGRTRWLARPGYASAVENHERGLDAGCSAGRSACPWPRRSPRCVSHTIRPLIVHTRRPEVVWQLAGAVPGLSSRSQPYRRLSGDCLRVLTSLRLVKPRQSQQTQAEPARPERWLPLTHSIFHAHPKTANRKRKNCWQPHRKLLASGSAVSD